MRPSGTAGSSPTGPTQVAEFGNGTTNNIANPPTVAINATVDGNYTLGGIVFDNNQGTTYNLSYGGSNTGLTLDNSGSGATVTVATGAGNPTIHTNLTLADNATFNVAAGSNLTLTNGGAGVGLGETGGSRSLTKTGAGTLTIDEVASNSGGTIVSNGTLTVTATGNLGATGPLEVDGLAGNAAVVNLDNSQSVVGLKGTMSGGGTARVNVASGTTLIVNQPTGTPAFEGTLALGTPGSGAALVKTGSGTLEVDGGLALGNGSSVGDRLGLAQGQRQFRHAERRERCDGDGAAAPRRSSWPAPCRPWARRPQPTGWPSKTTARPRPASSSPAALSKSAASTARATCRSMPAPA